MSCTLIMQVTCITLLICTYALIKVRCVAYENKIVFIFNKEKVGKRGFAISTIISKACISVAVDFSNYVCR